MQDGKNWLNFAIEDLIMAKLAMREKIYNQVCFHSQQTVEKVLKGYIENKKKNIPRTHKLIDILSVIKENIFEKDLKEKIVLLDRFYIPTRYPDALPGSLSSGLPIENDAKEALETASFVLNVMQKKFK